MFIFHYRYKVGCIKESETEDSGKPCAHIYYNQPLPESLILPPNEASKSFFYFMTVDTDKLRSYTDFNTG